MASTPAPTKSIVNTAITGSNSNYNLTALQSDPKTYIKSQIGQDITDVQANAIKTFVSKYKQTYQDMYIDDIDNRFLFNNVQFYILLLSPSLNETNFIEFCQSMDTEICTNKKCSISQSNHDGNHGCYIVAK